MQTSQSSSSSSTSQPSSPTTIKIIVMDFDDTLSSPGIGLFYPNELRVFAEKQLKQNRLPIIVSLGSNKRVNSELDSQWSNRVFLNMENLYGLEQIAQRDPDQTRFPNPTKMDVITLAIEDYNKTHQDHPITAKNVIFLDDSHEHTDIAQEQGVLIYNFETPPSANFFKGLTLAVEHPDLYIALKQTFKLFDERAEELIKSDKLKSAITSTTSHHEVVDRLLAIQAKLKWHFKSSGSVAGHLNKVADAINENPPQYDAALTVLTKLHVKFSQAEHIDSPILKK